MPSQSSSTPSPLFSCPLLEIQDLVVSFPAIASDRRSSARLRAVRDVSLSIYPRQTLALVGESGCGKSVTALSILRLLPSPPARYEQGRILWYPGLTPGSPVSATGPVDLLRLPERQMRSIRGGQIAMIFQEPMTSLNPVFTIGQQILEAILLHQNVNRSAALEIAVDALREVGIAEPAARLQEYPHQLSGGMRQRVMIAMALACQPSLLIADEPTTALDVTIQAQILDLLRQLQERRGMSILLITHDLGVVAENADVVAVMYAGRIVEYGRVEDVFDHPLHPYTQGLFASMPRLGQVQARLRTIPGNVPDLSELPSGCAFHPRCFSMAGDPRCAAEDPALREVRPQHWVACWHVPNYATAPLTAPQLPPLSQETQTHAS